MEQTRQGVQLTSNKDNNPQQKQHSEPEVMLDMKQQKTNKICAYIHHIKSSREGTAYGDLTGKYQIQSLNGNNYILIIYHYVSNTILAEPIRNREKGTILTAYRKIHQQLPNCG